MEEKTHISEINGRRIIFKLEDVEQCLKMGLVEDVEAYIRKKLRPLDSQHVS